MGAVVVVEEEPGLYPTRHDTGASGVRKISHGKLSGRSVPESLLFQAQKPGSISHRTHHLLLLVRHFLSYIPALLTFSGPVPVWDKGALGRAYPTLTGQEQEHKAFPKHDNVVQQRPPPCTTASPAGGTSPILAASQRAAIPRCSWRPPPPSPLSSWPGLHTCGEGGRSAS